jgi:flagellar protein FlgJ
MSSPSPDATTSSYLDFAALGRLKGQAAQDPKKALRASTEQFEAYFIQEMMKAMRKTVDKGDLLNSDHADMYQDMFDKEVALQMTKRGGLGLADMFEREMKRREAGAQPSTQQALALHPGAPAMPLNLPQGSALPLSRAVQKAYPLDGANGATP